MKGDSSTGFDFVYSDDLFLDGWGTNEDGFDELHSLLGAQSLMSFPKPSKLIAKLILSACRFDPESIVMDFFFRLIYNRTCSTFIKRPRQRK